MGDYISNKKGQATIFIIVAIIIVVFGIAIYFFWPEGGITTTGFDENPTKYLENCITPTLKENVHILSLQGGTLIPEDSTGYYTYKNPDDDFVSQIQYLCYTNKYYALCSNQQPLLKKHIEEELLETIQLKVKDCMSSLKKDYEGAGYEVRLTEGDTTVVLYPKKIITNINAKVTISKDTEQSYEKFEVVLDNNLYELINLARDIVDWEVLFGDWDTSSFMNYYPKFKFEKKLLSGGTKIIIITERATKQKFQFASRSKVMPMGFYVPELNEENKE